MNFRETLKINKNGHLEIGGADCVELARRFGTPLYAYDEKHIRNMMCAYRDTLEEEYEGGGCVLYASKAFSCMAIYAIARQEKIGIDVVSGGELYTAMQVGFSADKICMHGNNKLQDELEYALNCRVGLIVIDAYREADLLEREAQKRGMIQDVLIRVNPGVEAHTHAYVQTATPDSKFGFSIADGSAEKIAAYVLKKKHLRLKGFHCHIGSQIFEKQSFCVAADKMLDFVAKMRNVLHLTTEILNMGGGFGVWYTDEDEKTTPEGHKAYLRALIKTIKTKCAEYALPLPKLYIEPGRSIVGEAGITLYTVGNIKEIPAVKKYLAIDGGMFENPRYALYGSKYSAILANRAGDKPSELVSLAGKCCESGDIVGANINLPKANTGDLLAVFTTGAYHYSMASNYNRNFVPPAVLVKNGKAEYIVKPQSYADLVRNDAVPDYLNK